MPCLFSALFLSALIQIAPVQVTPARQDEGLLPPPPPVTAESDLSDIMFADRVVPDRPPTADGAVTPIQVILSPDDTGTGFNEPIWYQLPTGYDPEGAAVPMIVCWHGYGSSAGTVHAQSTIDEECDARGWIYLSVTGVDDQLFGPPIAQQNASAAIDWALNSFNVDADRIYMAGFSMGAGVVANYAARHRDPEGIMIAGIGMVAGAWDFTQTYNTGSPALQTMLEMPFNFGGAPSIEPFRYRQASSLYFAEATYPPLPGTLVQRECMAINLTDVAVYMVRDPIDATAMVQEQGPEMAAYLTNIGAGVSDHVEVTPSFFHHTWETLDEVELFDFLDGKAVTRYPTEFRARLDVAARVSYLELTPRLVEDFANVDASVDSGAGTLDLGSVDNTSLLTVHMDDAGLSAHAAPRITADGADLDGFRLQLTGFDERPSYLVDAVSEAYIAGVDSDPATNSLLANVPGGPVLDATVVYDPYWTTALWTSPQPAQVGGPIQFDIDAADGNGLVALVVVSASEQLVTLLDVTKFAAGFTPPSIIFALPLDANGNVTLMDAIPDEAAFSGARVVIQAAVFDAGAGLRSVSNLWGLRIQ